MGPPPVLGNWCSFSAALCSEFPQHFTFLGVALRLSGSILMDWSRVESRHSEHLPEAKDARLSILDFDVVLVAQFCQSAKQPKVVEPCKSR